MTKGDIYTKEILKRILEEGCKDINPRPKYSDGTPAHTLSVNHGMCTYDISKGETPLITLRPIAIKSAIGEILWIYQDESNDLEVLKNKYNVTWWDEWDIGNRTIGSVYGETVKRHRLVKNLLEGLEKDPDGRRHIMSLWQEDDFKEKHGLKPCAFLTQWNVRHEKDGQDYLDMCLTQRSSDFMTAGCINQMQYLVLQHLIARHLGMKVGRFTWFYNNIQIYDRHIPQAKEMLEREGVDCNIEIYLNEEKTNFYDFTIDDIEVRGYPREKIKEKNPPMKFDLGI
ncbi:MAG: thymidylate synthase [Bacilli bacterium]|nr:thymidylate synthase [Bacilli bacterium]